MDHHLNKMKTEWLLHTEAAITGIGNQIDYGVTGEFNEERYSHFYWWITKAALVLFLF